MTASTARTSTAKKTPARATARTATTTAAGSAADTTPTPAAAPAAAAVPATRKRTTGSARKTAAKKPAARKRTGTRPPLSLVKTPTAQARRTRRTLHPDFSDAEVYEARAALHATDAGIRVPIAAWTYSYAGGAEQILPDGTRLRHGGRHGDPFTASVPCLLGAVHVYDDIRTAADLETALRIAHTCEEPHTDLAAVAFGTEQDSEATLTLPLQKALAAPATDSDEPATAVAQDGDA